MLKEKVSVIVPIYNTESHLQRCLDSILSQTHDELEIILVDDGSTDQSAGICDSYATRDPRVIVVHKDNRGLSSARNTGIDLASSEYIQFVDSDDLIKPQMTEKLLALIRETDADIAHCDITRFRRPSDLYIHTAHAAASSNAIQVFTGAEKFKLLVADYPESVMQMNKLFRKNVFSNLRFPVGKYHEDEFLIHYEFEKAHAVAATKESLYFYFQNPNGIMGQMTAQKRLDGMEAFVDRLHFLSLHGYTEAAISTYLVLIGMIKHFEKEFCNLLPSSGQGHLEGSQATYRRALDAVRAEAERISDRGFPWKRSISDDRFDS